MVYAILQSKCICGISGRKKKHNGSNCKRWKSRNVRIQCYIAMTTSCCLVKVAASAATTWDPAHSFLLGTIAIIHLFSASHCSPCENRIDLFPETARPKINEASRASPIAVQSASKYSGGIYIIHEPQVHTRPSSRPRPLNGWPALHHSQTGPVIPTWQSLSRKDWDAFEIFNNALKIRKKLANYAHAHTHTHCLSFLQSLINTEQSWRK